MVIFRRAVLILLGGAIAAAIPFSAPRALDLGLTPSHVFSLWRNINHCLLAMARVVDPDPAWLDTLNQEKPRVVAGKTPADVLAHLAVYRRKLIELMDGSGIRLEQKPAAEDADVTPSVVYLNSGYILNAQVTWLIANTPRQQIVSPFYTRHDFAGKTSGDVFTLVDLAIRRIDRVLARVETRGSGRKPHS